MTNRPPRRPTRDPSPAALGPDLVAALEAAAALVRRLGPPRDLSPTTATTLAALSREGPARLSDLADRGGVSQPAMTQLVSRLERDGFARRRSHPADGRVVMVEITGAGEALLDRRRAARAERLTPLLADLAAADRAAIVAALPVLARLTALATDAPSPQPAWSTVS